MTPEEALVILEVLSDKDDATNLFPQEKMACSIGAAALRRGSEFEAQVEFWKNAHEEAVELNRNLIRKNGELSVRVRELEAKLKDIRKRLRSSTAAHRILAETRHRSLPNG